jgi:preprotein translocase subunit YajC
VTGGGATPGANPGTPGTPGTTDGGGLTTSTGTGDNQKLPEGTASGPGYLNILIITAMIAMFWFVLIGPQRKEKKRRAAMLSALKKGDKVATIGGEIGTVVEVNDQNVLLKVDESSNTRIRYLRSAIQGVVEEKAVETTEKK